ncbi:MAG: helix-turn-helix transcriptional regulator [Bacilli bacterium]|nr:helix-turn-helix transcriptional regulator [Bacilli bacterium]
MLGGDNIGSYFKTNLKYIRNQKGISQKQLADKIGVDQSTISYWEKGMDVTVDNAVKVAEALNIPVPEFLGVDLRVQEDIKKTIFNKDGVEITIAHNGELNDKMLLEINNLLLNEKILKEELKETDARNAEK